MFSEYSGNIALRLLEFGKISTFAMVKPYTFNTKDEFSSINFYKNIFFKMFSKCSLDTRDIATLREHSANIPGILRAGWDKEILIPSDILTSKYHKWTGFHEYFEFPVTFLFFYLLEYKFVDLKIFSFFQGKICAPRTDADRARNLCKPVLRFYHFLIFYKKFAKFAKRNIKTFLLQHIFPSRPISELILVSKYVKYFFSAG